MAVQPHSVKYYISVRSNVNVSFGQMLNAAFPMISFHKVLDGASEGAGASSMSIQKTKHPERYLIAAPGLDIVVDDETVGHIRYLLECLALAADFKHPFPVHDEIALRGGDDLIPRRLALIGEKRFADSSDFRPRHEGVHEVRVAQKNP